MFRNGAYQSREEHKRALLADERVHTVKCVLCDDPCTVESNVDSALKQVSRALLDADVSFSVVKDFVAEVREKAIGAEVVRGISPDQKFIQIVHEQLVEIMGGSHGISRHGSPQDLGLGDPTWRCPK